MASGMVTVVTQSSTITTSVLVPFVGTGILITGAGVYPVVVGSNLGTTFTVQVFAAFAGVGRTRGSASRRPRVTLPRPLRDRRDLRDPAPAPRAAVLRREPRARVAAERRWVLAVYLGTVFVALPALVIVLVGVV